MSNVHAMPVMLLVLAILAVAYRYLQRVPGGEGRGAGRLADHSGPRALRRAELPPDQPLGPLRAPLRGDLGSGAADRAGPGDPVRLLAGAGLAGRRRLPGGRGAGHDGPGGVGSPRGPEPRRAGPDRDRAGRGDGHDAGHPLRDHHRAGGPGDRRRQGTRRRGSADEGGDTAGLSRDGTLPQGRFPQPARHRPHHTSAARVDLSLRRGA